MKDLSSYTAVSKTPDWTGVDKDRLIDFYAARYGVPKEGVDAMFRSFVGWFCDNELTKSQ